LSYQFKPMINVTLIFYKFNTYQNWSYFYSYEPQKPIVLLTRRLNLAYRGFGLKYAKAGRMKQFLN
ncbi:hypothetical protein C1141_14750, partial [Vibrio agarivorans]